MAIEIYDITTELSDQDIYSSVLHQDALDAGLSTLTSVDANAAGNSNKVRFHFPSPLSGPDKTTLDGVVAAYDPASTQPVLDSTAAVILEDVDASATERVWALTTDTATGTATFGTCSDAGAPSDAVWEATRTGETVGLFDVKVPMSVAGEVTASAPTSGTALTTMDFVQGLLDARDQGVEWQTSVLSVLNTPPGSPTADDRHIVGTSPTDDYATHADEFAVYNGSTWDFYVPSKGMSVIVDNPYSQINFNGTLWVSLGSIVLHNNTMGLTDGDPHTQYQLGSGKNAASGYAGLTAGSKLTGSQQVYGTAVDTACVGNDARLSDSRTPTSHTIVSHDTTATGANLNTLTGGGDADSQHTHAALQLTSAKNAASGYPGLDGSSKLTGTQQVYGSAANTACVGNDSRLSNARTPTTHGLGGAEHSSATLAQLNALVSDATLDTSSASRTPSTHATSHSDGGSDEIAIENLATSGASGKVPTSDGSGGLTMETPAGGVFGTEWNAVELLAEQFSEVTDLVTILRLPASDNITLPAGTYRLEFSTIWRAGSGDTLNVDIEQGGVLLPTKGQLDLRSAGNSAHFPMYYKLDIVLTAGNYNWEVLFRSLTGTGDVWMSDNQLSIFRIV